MQRQKKLTTLTIYINICIEAMHELKAENYLMQLLNIWFKEDETDVCTNWRKILSDSIGTRSKQKKKKKQYKKPNNFIIISVTCTTDSIVFHANRRCRVD